MRIAGDEGVAATFWAAQRSLSYARHELSDNRPVGAMEHLVRAEVALREALEELEALTNVPWTALVKTPPA